MRLVFVGGGVMGEAIIRGLLQGELLSPKNIVVIDVQTDRLEYLKDRYDVEIAVNSREAMLSLRRGEIAIIAVKPQALSGVFAELHGSIGDDQTVLSIVAGTTMSALVEGFGSSSVVRVMPNTPAQIGQGISVWTATSQVTDEVKDVCRSIISALGEEIFVSDEKFIDMATALSAGGPAYVFLIIEALTDAGVQMGFSRDIAQKLVLQTILGSALLVQETGKQPTELKSMVTSPGGTTIEGLLEMENRGIRGALINGVLAAYRKAKSLGGRD